MRGNTSAKISTIAIGNRLRYPNGEFPAWVREHERDPLLWISGTDGMSLVQKIIGATILFMFVVGSKLGSTTPLRALSEWQIGPATHLWVVKASSHLHTCMMMGSAVAADFIVFLLASDLCYVCPQTLASLSACLRSSALIRTFVFLCWCKLSLHSPALQHFTMEREKQKKWTAKILWKRLLLWWVWCVLTLVLSILAVLYQVAQSIPGFSSSWKILVVGPESLHWGHPRIGEQLHLCLVLLAEITRQKHAFATVSVLLMNCVIPIVVIVYLDIECLGRWVSFWKTCRSNSQQFQTRLVCNGKDDRYCDVLLSTFHDVDVMVIKPSDICDPHVSVDFDLHVKVHPHRLVPDAGGLACQVCHDRSCDARREPHEEQIAHGVIRSRGQFWGLHRLSIVELRPSTIDEYNPLRCLLG